VKNIKMSIFLVITCAISLFDNPNTWKEIQEQRKFDPKNIKTYQLIQPCDEEEKPHAHRGRK